MAELSTCDLVLCRTFQGLALFAFWAIKRVVMFWLPDKQLSRPVYLTLGLKSTRTLLVTGTDRQERRL